MAVVEKWFKPKVKTGWKKTQKPSYRRRLVMRAHKGSLLSGRRSLVRKTHRSTLLAAGRSMTALANVTKDKATAKAARADARYFFRKLD